LKPGDEVILSEMEHHSNLIPWQLMTQATGAKLKFLPITDDGRLVIEALPGLVSPRTKLISVTQMSNVLGTITPISEIVQFAHPRGILVAVDGAQGVPHLGADVQALGCDFLAFSSHKMLGPTGVGILYGKEALLEAMDPFLGGGEMIREVHLEHFTWNELPWKYEAGTPNVADVYAFGTALRYLNRLGMAAIRQHEVELTRYALKRLLQVEDLVIYGPKDAESRGGVISFNLGDLHPHDLGTALDYEGIAVRAGHHCAQPLMRRLGVVATARASFYVYNTPEEVDRLIEALVKARAFFTHATRTTR
jgi:cysteine desulfurase/selenocysteine lyase